MKATVEISMYPLQENYRDLIKDFIDGLHRYPEMEISTSHTSTTVIGDYDEVMAMITALFKWSHDTHGRAVFVTKIIPGYDPR